MRLVQITPGAGAMYCGLCFRDNALVAALRQMGHDVVMVPLYLPLTLDEGDQSAGAPIFFNGINVYLEQKSAFFRAAPAWVHGLFKSRSLLKMVAGKAAKTRPEEVGELTLSMLRGEEGNQVRELDELIAWLKTQPQPDLICLSTALLAGLVRKLKAELRAPVVCMFQGEDYFLDSLPEAKRAACWKTLAERAAEADLFVAASQYFADVMSKRLSLPAERVRVIYNGINVAGYAPGSAGPNSGVTDSPQAGKASANATEPVLGYFARMCREKGLDTLVEAFIILRRRGRIKNPKLRVGGGCGPTDEPFVDQLKEQLRAAGVLAETEFCPNLDRNAKVDFLRSLSVFSVPALYGEAFGMYLIEALAAGVPVVQPRSGAFPEVLGVTGGGVLCAAGDPAALAEAIEGLLLDPGKARALGEAGRRNVFENFSAEAMAKRTLEVYGPMIGREMAGRSVKA